jgi:hypothetical protein
MGASSSKPLDITPNSKSPVFPQVDHFSKHHRIGSDFLVLQNERFDDWKPTLLQLRKLFTDYKSCIVDYHKTGNPEKDQFIPKGIFKWFLIYYKYLSPSK